MTNRQLALTKIANDSQEDRAARLCRLLESVVVRGGGCHHLPRTHTSVYGRGVQTTLAVHRLVALLILGRNPDKVTHTCNDMRCVNPRHILVSFGDEEARPLVKEASRDPDNWIAEMACSLVPSDEA